MKTAILLTLCLIAFLIVADHQKLPLLTGSASPVLQIASSKSNQKILSPKTDKIKTAFGKQGIRISQTEAVIIKDSVTDALQQAHEHGIGNSKVDFISIDIAQKLELDIGQGSKTVHHITSAIQYLLKQASFENKQHQIAWKNYYKKTLSLNSDQNFLALVRKEKFSPVKISWEDIGRHQGSVWGDRISDVGIWVRQNESDPQSAALALSVRRDQNFRDKILVVPSERIKIHRKQHGKTQELTLSQRLRELDLYSKKRDRNVIVSNQFAVLPVPAHDMKGAWKDGVPPRAAFNFSIYPYGSTNYVITDVIEGSSEAIVGPGNHQYLYYNIDGKKAPFTASRAEDRPDLLELEARLKAQGMDVDVQRYYLIQIPLKKGNNIELSNMGTPPMNQAYLGSVNSVFVSGNADVLTPITPPSGAPKPKAKSKKKRRGLKIYDKMITIHKRRNKNTKMYIKKPISSEQSLKKKDLKTATTKKVTSDGQVEDADSNDKDPTAGLTKVAIGHGEVEGQYKGGRGFQGMRDDAPIRVTVVYFVTPIGEVTPQDMKTFTAAFKKWDTQAIWGGSFVTKESW